MIKEHEFNSRWWGTPVGIVTDAQFFELPLEDQTKLLSKFDWVEYRMASIEEHLGPSLVRSGFYCADVQIHFRVKLSRIEGSQCFSSLNVYQADKREIVLEPSDIKQFRSERFRTLPNISPEKIEERYLLWSRTLVAESPETALSIYHGEKCQGWFLSEVRQGVLDLTLAMLSSQAAVSGHTLYEKAIDHYASCGFRIGQGSFSVHNMNVLNIYSALGARFSAPQSYWFWVGESANREC
jgi:hypothetical protein